jgi:general stress protein YciG
MAEREDNISREELSGNMQNRERFDDSSDNGNDSSERRTSNRGFAAMDPEKQRSIASEGGRAAHRQGVAHEWSSEEAREAGRKGGQIVSRNREHMSEIGRRGGQSSGSRRSQKNNNSTPNNEA